MLSLQATMRYLKKLSSLKPSHIFVLIFVVTLLASTLLSFRLALISDKLLEKATNSLVAQAKTISYAPMPFNTPTPTPKKIEAKPSPNSWGVAKQIDEKTWTMQVSNDEKMGTADEIFSALNHYRNQNGAGSLSWDNTLSDFAKKRAATFISIGGLDAHAGFNEYFKNQENMKNMGLSGVGENSSYGYKLAGVHLIEWVFAGDAPHNNNQLDKNWTHVGIAVSGTAVDVVFGKK